MMEIDFGVAVAFLTAVIVAYLGFRHQQRLKAFELFLDRRERVLAEVAEEIDRLYAVLDSLSGGDPTQLSQYTKRAFRDNLGLYHRMETASFGEAADALAQTFWAISEEPRRPESRGVDSKGWIGRMLNVLSTYHAFGHAKLSYEMRLLSQPFPVRLLEHWKEWKRARRAKRTMDTMNQPELEGEPNTHGV